MPAAVPDLDRLQHDYQSSLEAWIATIREEQVLAALHHSEADLDRSQAAHDAQEQARHNAQSARDAYQNALRRQFFNF